MLRTDEHEIKNESGDYFQLTLLIDLIKANGCFKREMNCQYPLKVGQSIVFLEFFFLPYQEGKSISLRTSISY